MSAQQHDLDNLAMVARFYLDREYERYDDLNREARERLDGLSTSVNVALRWLKEHNLKEAA